MRKYIALLLLLALTLVLLPMPVNASTTVTIYTSSSDGRIRYVDGTYNTALDSTTGTVSDVSSFNYLGQYYNGNYGINRAFLFFDTSSIDSRVTITSASIKLYGVDDYSDTNFNITVQTGTASTYPHDPLQTSDYDKTLYTGNGGTFDTSGGFSTSSYNTLNLNATGIGWINKGGLTKFCLRSDRDIAGTTPTGNEYVVFYTQESSIFKPYLYVTYTADTPSITVVTASNISLTTARLNSSITSDGGEATGDTQVRFGYGTTTQAAVDFEDYDTVTAWVDGYSEGDYPYLDIDSLSDTTTYYYRAQVKNASANATSANEITFDTLTTLDDVSVFNGTPTKDSVNLHWVLPSGATQALIMYRTDTYPTTTADGTQAYLGSSSTTSHSGLTAGTTYYYSIWGKSGASYSGNAKNLAVTTLGSDSTPSTGDSLPTPTLPPEMFQEPDTDSTSPVSNLEPFYSLFKKAAESLGMPSDTFWGMVAFVMIGIVSLLVLLATHSVTGALFTSIVGLMVAVALKILPWEFIGLLIPLGLGAWATSKNEGNNI